MTQHDDTNADRIEALEAKLAKALKPLEGR